MKGCGPNTRWDFSTLIGDPVIKVQLQGEGTI